MSDFTQDPDALDPTPLQPAVVPPGQPAGAPAPLLAGCMECKAQRPYTVKAWPNGNTTWHCTVCGKVVRLVGGPSLPDSEVLSGQAVVEETTPSTEKETADA